MVAYLINPKRRSMAKRGKKRRTAAQKRATQKMIAARKRKLRKRVASNPKRKKRKKATRKRAKTTTRRTKTVAKRKRRKSTKRRKATRKRASGFTVKARRPKTAYISNPKFTMKNIGKKLQQGVFDAAAVVGGKAATRVIASFIPLPKDSMIMNFATQAVAAMGVGMIAQQFVSPSVARFMFAGGLAAPVETFMKQLPVIGDYLGDDFLTMGEYPTHIGAYPEPEALGEYPTHMGAYPEQYEVMAG